MWGASVSHGYHTVQWYLCGYPDSLITKVHNQTEASSRSVSALLLNISYFHMLSKGCIQKPPNAPPHWWGVTFSELAWFAYKVSGADCCYSNLLNLLRVKTRVCSYNLYTTPFFSYPSQFTLVKLIKLKRTQRKNREKMKFLVIFFSKKINSRHKKR